MPIYSHSQLSVYEQCPLKYKLQYRDRIKRYVENIEAFLGSRVHETLRKCHEDAKLGRVNTPMDMFIYYDKLWQKKWHDEIVITRENMTHEDYREMGRSMLGMYYQRYAPFNLDRTISTEMRLNFSLTSDDSYRLIGVIDRLSRARDGTYQIHDYKTSSHLPGQDEINRDRQLGLYYIGIRKKWPDIKNIRLIWHYLSFDREFLSSRSDEEISQLIYATIHLIDEIEATRNFPPRESRLCDWCEYPDLCPLRKHFHEVDYESTKCSKKGENDSVHPTNPTGPPTSRPPDD